MKIAELSVDIKLVSLLVALLIQFLMVSSLKNVVSKSVGDSLLCILLTLKSNKKGFDCYLV